MPVPAAGLWHLKMEKKWLAPFLFFLNVACGICGIYQALRRLRRRS